MAIETKWMAIITEWITAHLFYSITRLSLGRHRRRPAEEVRLKGFGTLDQPTFKQLKEATGNA
ncbi:hypothetical protein BLOT_003221 [Blomia tropicalis]|nr:hypothetical protein BLOT_003221 [Blomia tropicalis]